MPPITRIYRQSAQRKRELQAQLQEHLEVFDYPKFWMSALVVITALTTFIFSFVLYQIGLTDLGLRYLIVWVLSYLWFVGLLRLWLVWRLNRENLANSMELANVLPDVKTPSLDSNHFRFPTAPTSDYQGEGGQFGGSGTEGRWSSSPSSKSNLYSYNTHDGIDNKSAFAPESNATDGLDAESLPFVIIMAIVGIIASMLGGLVWASYSLINAAPALLAELLADILIINGLGRQLRVLPIHSNYWFATIWQRTWVFFCAITGLLVILLLVLHVMNIEAQTLGELIELF